MHRSVTLHAQGKDVFVFHPGWQNGLGETDAVSVGDFSPEFPDPDESFRPLQDVENGCDSAVEAEDSGTVDTGALLIPRNDHIANNS